MPASPHRSKTARLAHVCPDDETIAQLLERGLDTALGEAMAEDTVVDKVLPEIKRRHSPP